MRNLVSDRGMWRRKKFQVLETAAGSEEAHGREKVAADIGRETAVAFFGSAVRWRGGDGVSGISVGGYRFHGKSETYFLWR